MIGKKETRKKGKGGGRKSGEEKLSLKKRGEEGRERV